MLLQSELVQSFPCFMSPHRLVGRERRAYRGQLCVDAIVSSLRVNMLNGWSCITVCARDETTLRSNAVTTNADQNRLRPYAPLWALKQACSIASESEPIGQPKLFKFKSSTNSISLLFDCLLLALNRIRWAIHSTAND